MEVLDLNVFLTFKTNPETQELDSKTLETLNNLFSSFDKKNKNSKSGTNILKNHKIQNKKETITNRVNLILNKLSESNMDSLIYEFIENINQVNEEQFNEIQKAFYVKIISEINFIKIYLQFFKIISYIYNKVLNYDISYFYSMIEMKFKIDYMGYVNNEMNDNTEECKRINNLCLLKNFIENKFLVNNMTLYCDNVILSQTKYLPDIYFWFNSKNRELTKDEASKIKSITTNPNIKLLSRDKVLLESLINKTKVISDTKPVVTNVVTNNVVTNSNIIVLECNNIIEEYILMKSFDDIKYFIETRCTDAITKNKFCYTMIDKYFVGNKETASDIIELTKQLIKSQILFKSNLSRGLLLLYNNWKDVMVDYIKPVDKMKTLLLTLKSIGITKGLENLLDTYKVE
jgi:hypothetical protein